MKEITAKIVTQIPGPNSLKLFERRKKAVSNGVSYGSKVFAAEAKGALIKDVDGNVFIDFASGIGVVNIGHCDNDVTKAIHEQTDKYIHTSINVCQYEPYVALAEKLCALVIGETNKKAMFANSGAEAIENAVKIARKYTGKTAIISLESSFHGRTYMAMSITSKTKPYKYGFAPFNSDTYKLPSPNCYRCSLGKECTTCNLACARRLAEMLESELAPEMVAAVIVEPVQGEGGFIVPPSGYLEAIQEICNNNNILLVIDEIQAGFSRTGRMFSYQHSDIEPDIITMSKSIAGGLPLSAVVGKADIMDAPISGSIGGTYCGNPVACAAALAVIEKMEKEDFPSKALHIGAYLTARLNAMSQKYSIIGDIRGQGAMVAVEFVKDRETKGPYKEIVEKIINECLLHGVIFISAGIYGNCIRFLPPLVITDEQLAYGMDILEDAIASCL